jgi:hypothetical protein
MIEPAGEMIKSRSQAVVPGGIGRFEVVQGGENSQAAIPRIFAARLLLRFDLAPSRDDDGEVRWARARPSIEPGISTSEITLAPRKTGPKRSGSGLKEIGPPRPARRAPKHDANCLVARRLGRHHFKDGTTFGKFKS